MVKLLLLFVIFTFSIGCGKLKDEELSMQRTDYLSNELRIDGYYYYFHNDGVNPESVVVCFLYRNGIIRACGASASLQDFENNIDVYNTSTSKSYKEAWGAFLINDNIIVYERWYGARFLEPHRTYIYEGKILNDTTFNITQSYRQDGSERDEKNDIYHFRKFSPKPDSTNRFIP